ncbi:hypothetical protein [Salinirubrum litoreum]|uniref:Uncharacterized protein n=1 Tax=Salinirubrum litoreum TaxID=1126234 RepID=A0ABD5R5Y8_9EURY|nr:hypothetical protein [Salinirubrum litoreum]
MTRTTKIAALAVCLLLATSAVSATAFTSITLQRNANIDVVADDTGIVQLSAGSSDFVTLDNGQLAIDVTNGGASGTNVNSTLEIGENATSPTTNAFTITNNDESSHSFTLSYGSLNSDSDTAPNVEFAVFDETGDREASISENSDGTFTMPSGDTFEVVLVVDTTGSATGDDLSGTLTITSS